MSEIYQYDIFNDKKNMPYVDIIHTFACEDDEAETMNLSEQIFVICCSTEMHKLESEHLYVVALDGNHMIKGLYLLGIGSPNKIEYYEQRNMTMFLVLVGAVEFYTLHNHPNNILDASVADTALDAIFKKFGKITGIKCIGNYAVTEYGYVDLCTREKKYYNEEV